MQISTGQISETTIAYVMMQEHILLESRLDYLKANTKPFDTSHDTGAQHHDVSGIVDHFAGIDPSKNKKNTQYLLNLYRTKTIRQEDAPRIQDALTNFEKFKHKLPADKRSLNVKDYPTTSSVQDAVKSHVGAEISHVPTQSGGSDLSSYDRPGHEKHYEDDKIAIFHVSDKAMSKKMYGRKNDPVPGVCPTEWCTATHKDDHNKFDHYNKSSNLYAVHRKSDGDVFQYHTHGTGQFMDKKDETISDGDFMSIAPSLHKAWREKPYLLGTKE